MAAMSTLLIDSFIKLSCKESLIKEKGFSLERKGLPKEKAYFGNLQAKFSALLKINVRDGEDCGIREPHISSFYGLGATVPLKNLAKNLPQKIHETKDHNQYYKCYDEIGQ